jgi:hypothetical protein
MPKPKGSSTPVASARSVLRLALQHNDEVAAVTAVRNLIRIKKAEEAERVRDIRAASASLEDAR